jgi:hypothetical protein
LRARRTGRSPGITFVLQSSGAAIVCIAAASASAQGSNCGNLANAIGPYDYRSDRDKLPIVESAHFTPEVETLIRGNGGYLVQDIDYTLRAFPNHHRALLSMMRLGERTKSPQPQGSRYTVDCYFERAVRFRPDDPVVRMLFATHLLHGSRNAEAVPHVDHAASIAGENPFTHFNAGMLYVDLKSYDKALREAHIAYGSGFVRPELRDALKAAGKWVEPPAGAALAAVPAAAASAVPAADAAASVSAR